VRRQSRKTLFSLVRRADRLNDFLLQRLLPDSKTSTLNRYSFPSSPRNVLMQDFFYEGAALNMKNSLLDRFLTKVVGSARSQ
jgi:hypothetical protein